MLQTKETRTVNEPFVGLRESKEIEIKTQLNRTNQDGRCDGALWSGL